MLRWFFDYFSWTSRENSDVESFLSTRWTFTIRRFHNIFLMILTFSY